MKKGKYLITGCAGFIGSKLVKSISKKYEMILVDDLSGGSIRNLEKKNRKKLIRKCKVCIMNVIKTHFVEMASQNQYK